MPIFIDRGAPVVTKRDRKKGADHAIDSMAAVSTSIQYERELKRGDLPQLLLEIMPV